jgi:NitT/TauT family transport system permease protein
VAATETLAMATATTFAPKPLSTRLGEATANALPVIAVALIFIGAWYLLCATVYAGKGYLVPSPQEVWAAVAENAGVLAIATLTTLKEATLGYLAAIVLGVGLAGVLSQSKLLERSIYPYAVLLQTVPVVAIAPLIVLWFGYNDLSVVIISFIMSVFPIVNNTLLGLRSTSRNLTELFALHNTSRLVAFAKLRLPGALPNIFAGLRISAGLSVIGAIVGEFIIGSGNAQGGLGVQIVFAQGRMYTALLFAEVIAATLLGFFFFLVVSAIGRLLLKNWHESAVGD